MVLFGPPHPADKLKINMDSLTWGNRGFTSCGGVCRDDLGSVIGIFSGLLGILDSNAAEVFTISHVLKFFIEFEWVGKKGVIVESDSRNVISWVLNSDSRS